MLIIPAIDILDNKVARLTKGDFNQATFYETTPIKVAEKYYNVGFKWVHIVDLSATLSQNIGILPILKEIKKKTNLLIQFGGGIRKIEQVNKLLNGGVDRIIIGSLSINNKDEFEKIIEKFGTKNIVVAIDSENEKILIKGWTKESNVSIYDHIQYCSSLGIDTFLCTDVSRDGTLQGSNVELYKKIMNKFPNIKLIASGGIGSLHDIMMLSDIDLYAVIVGKAIYENKIKLEDLIKIGS
ncbi:MAG: 1-(5-phosphoribosyl)-5-[(5-phosphoribosylamino)methylideneamino]imidazole-4-carboxamide isomerase [Melioribacter sp.]|nr:1-(5-phosphoribosyl)-5-[(5-phosphoribosylamino)methylideneamino]imidazole-4-carboxamide isomerase [Melioribacter sp.]